MSSSRRYRISGGTGHSTPAGGSGGYSAPADRRPAKHSSHNHVTDIGEDELVAKVVNHAHDIASAHGAADVMLEHLLHALARVSEAAAILDDEGYNVERLRRECAAVIAGEIRLKKFPRYVSFADSSIRSRTPTTRRRSHHRTAPSTGWGAKMTSAATAQPQWSRKTALTTP